MQLINVIEIPSQNCIMVIREKRVTRFITLNNIVYISSCSYLSVVHTTSGEEIIVSKILKAFEHSLDGLGFIRISRSIMVNLFYVDRYEAGKRSMLVMSNGMLFSVTRKYSMCFSR
ncbi:MAG: LytTR family transcriptional regulator [Bacteroidales bacterium]|nr:LytTR family transcriptional regulator [Bacteroidales bacterium]MBN2749715.1 LytTR family transcriptional regulator [Bacteroidales bacterium]